jgi:hypothetical protein
LATRSLRHGLSRLATCIEGTCIKHRFGKSAIKMYDKFTLVLRLEITTNEVSSFKHHRKVEHRKGPATRDLAPVKKTIHSLPDLRAILPGCKRRYLSFLSALDDFSAGARALDRLIRRASWPARPSKASFSSIRTTAVARPSTAGLQYRRHSPHPPSSCPRQALSI